MRQLSGKCMRENRSTRTMWRCFRVKAAQIVAGLIPLISLPVVAAPNTADELFSTSSVRHLEIEIPAKGIERLRGRGWSWGWGGATRERPEVEATVREGNLVYTNV